MSDPTFPGTTDRSVVRDLMVKAAHDARAALNRTMALTDGTGWMAIVTAAGAEPVQALAELFCVDRDGGPTADYAIFAGLLLGRTGAAIVDRGENTEIVGANVYRQAVADLRVLAAAGLVAIDDHLATLLDMGGAPEGEAEIADKEKDVS